MACRAETSLAARGKIRRYVLHRSPYFLHSFANGRGTALVVDAGAEYTTVTPVYDGAALLSSARRTKVGRREGR